MRPARQIARYAVLVAATVFSLYPVLWLVMVSLKTREEYVADPIGLPDGLNFHNFGTVLGNDAMLGYFLNSIVVVGLAVPIMVASAVAAGYALARLWGRAGIGLLLVFLFSEFVPIAVIVIPLLLTVKDSASATAWCA